MKGHTFFLVLAAILWAVDSKISEPLVKLYSQEHGEFGMENILICHVSQFQPPNIDIQLQKNGQDIPGANMTDLAFEVSWQFHLTKSAPFTPQKNEEYACVVTHQGKSKKYTWESNM